MKESPDPEMGWSEDILEEAKKGQAHSSLLQVLNSEEIRTGSRDLAMDLGCGYLEDTRAMANHFKHVIATDIRPESGVIHKKLSPGNVEFHCVDHLNYDFPTNACDLINAQYSLFFTSRENLMILMEKIKTSLKPGGVFVGTFLGPDDSWNKEPFLSDPDFPKSFLTKEEVAGLFSGMSEVMMEEKKTTGPGRRGGSPKKWHVFRVVFRK